MPCSWSSSCVAWGGQEGADPVAPQPTQEPNPGARFTEGEQVKGKGWGFRVGLARTPFRFPARGSQRSIEDSCWWCDFSPLAPKTLGFPPSWELGIDTWPDPANLVSLS